ncbi:MAG: hypothetical protein ACLRLE_03855 [Turicibacter sp.]|uniref:hypothetical protein n=1 Tax=Turicibacter sp. GALT-G1 TaxID=2951140 RepID=UPI0021D504BF|nr:hypothetical protein [Turicibacter sp. GALT-G1]MCU7206561.1 hypothetical protein [Turicibacter sp. GALT-G1]
MIENKGMTPREYYSRESAKAVETYKEIIQWSEAEFEAFENVLDELRKVNDRGIKGKNNPTGVTTKEKGDALENVVRFIIESTSFFEMHGNIRTDTNEVDQVVIFSKRGKQILEDAKIARGIIPIPIDMFICECKNYKDRVGVTWIGKFYGLLTACSSNFGILFTTEGITGDDEYWIEAKGLLRTFHLIEKLRNNTNFCIIEFNMNDFEKISKEKLNFFDLVEAKINGVRMGASYEQFLKDCNHKNEQKIMQLMETLR